MPVNVVVVHNDLRFVEEVVKALRLVGRDVATFGDPVEALDAIDAMPHLDILLTRVRFPPGRGNGVALASGVRMKKPGVKVVFTVAPENIEYAEGTRRICDRPHFKSRSLWRR
jgi:DNA-binding NtrC family response regulator